MKVDFTLINPVNHYRKTLVDNLAILNLRAVSEAAGFSTHVIDFQRKFLEEEKTFSKEIYRWFSDEIRTTLKKGGLLLGYNPRAPGSRLKARARTSSRPSAS